MVKIKTLDILKFWLSQRGIAMLIIELVAMIVLAITTKSLLNPWIILIAVIAILTATTAWSLRIEKDKESTLWAWQKLGQQVWSFPLTDEDRQATVTSAQKMLGRMAQEVTDAFDARDSLIHEHKKLDTKYLYGSRSVASKSERDEIQKDLIKLEAEIEKAKVTAQLLRDRYLDAWDLLTRKMNLLPGVVTEFRTPEAFRDWACKNLRPLAIPRPLESRP